MIDLAQTTHTLVRLGATSSTQLLEKLQRAFRRRISMSTIQFQGLAMAATGKQRDRALLLETHVRITQSACHLNPLCVCKARVKLQYVTQSVHGNYVMLYGESYGP